MKTLTPRLTRAAALALAPLLLLAATPARPQSPAPKPPEGKAVTVILTAAGMDGRAFKTLKAEDLSVEEGGKPCAVTGLEHRADLPLLLAVGIDTSMSQERVIDATKMAADELVQSLMRPGTDRAAVFTFTNEATLEQEMTADAGKVRAAISRVEVSRPPGYVGGGVLVVGRGRQPQPPAPGSTAVWDAVAVVSGDAMWRPLAPGRRAVILITDGVDTYSRFKPEEAARSAIRAGVAVYPVGIGDDELGGVEVNALRKLAERTGGRAFFPKKVKHLPEVFAGLREELFSAYALTFTSPHARPDGSFRKLKVTVKGPEARKSGVEVAYPQGYFAGNATAPLK